MRVVFLTTRQIQDTRATERISAENPIAYSRQPA